MKSIRKKTIGLLALLMAFVMLVGACLPAGALSIEHSTNGYTEPCYSIEYSDKRLKISINAEIVYDILKDKQLTKDELTALIPSDILDAMDKGRDITPDELIELASRYVTLNDIKEMLGDLPNELVSQYISLELLEELISMDALLEAIPFDSIFAAANDASVTALLTDDVMRLMLNDAALNRIANNVLISDIVENSTLVDDINTNAELKQKVIALFDDETVNAILTDAQYADIKANLQNYVLSDGIVQKILRDDGTAADKIFKALLETDPDSAVQAQKQADIEEFFSAPAVKNILFTANNLMSSDLVSTLIDSGVITKDIAETVLSDVPPAQLAGAINPDGSINTDGFYAIISSDGDKYFGRLLNAVDHREIIRAVDGTTLYGIVISNSSALFGNSNVIAAFNEAFEPLENDFIMTALGGYRGILSTYCDIAYVLRNVVTYNRICDVLKPIDILNAIGVDRLLGYTSVSAIIESAGGAGSLLSLYTNDELAEIFTAVGTDNIRTFIETSGVLDAIDVKQTASDIIEAIRENGDVKQFVKKIIYTTSQIFTNDIESITLGNASNPFYYIGKISLNSLLEGLISSLPITDGRFDIASVMDNGLSASVSLVLGDRFANKSYTYTAELEFTGDTTGLKSILEKLDNYVELDISQGFDGDGVLNNIGMNLGVTVPEIFSVLYAEILNNSIEGKDISRELRQKLLLIPTKTPADAAELIDSVTDEQRREIYDFLIEKLDSVKNKASSVSRTQLDEKIDALTDYATFSKLFDKASEIFGKLADSSLGNISVADIYDNGGNAFRFGAGKTLNIYDFIVNSVSLPDTIAMWFADRDLSVRLDTRMTLTGIYVLTYTDANGETEKTLVPEGADIDVINDLLGIQSNVTLTFAFKDTDGNTLASDITRSYTYGISKEELISELRNDSAFVLEGYTFSDVTGYDPNGAKEQSVTAVYTVNTSAPERVTITFTDDGGTVLGTFSFEYGISATAIIDAVNANTGNIYASLLKNGYTVTGLTGYTADGGEAQTVTLVYTGNIYRAVWKDGSTIIKEENWVFGSGNYPAAPSIPTKNGYTGAWNKTPDFTSPANIEISVVWTANKYTVTFKGHEKDIYVEWIFGTVPTAPEVPYKYGHDGAWEDYASKLNIPSDFTVNAVYTLHIYTATFVADGEKVAEVDFTVNDTSITEPKVPEKSGYVGKWEEYSITDKDITVNAVYTPVTVGDTDTDTDSSDGTVSSSGKHWSWIGLILIVLLVAGGLYGYIRKKSDDDDGSTPPPPAPTPEPTPETDTGSEEENKETDDEKSEIPDEEPLPITVVESVSVDEVDELMSDNTALKLIQTRSISDVEGLRVIVNIDKINEVFNAGDTVNLETLKQKKLISQRASRVKILANGNIDKPLNIEANAFSVQAVKMITLTGGTVTLTVIEK